MLHNSHDHLHQRIRDMPAYSAHGHGLQQLVREIHDHDNSTLQEKSLKDLTCTVNSDDDEAMDFA